MRLSVHPDGRNATEVEIRGRYSKVMGPKDAIAALEIAAGLGASGTVTQRLPSGDSDEWFYRTYRVTPSGARVIVGCPYDCM